MRRKADVADMQGHYVNFTVLPNGYLEITPTDEFFTEVETLISMRTYDAMRALFEDIEANSDWEWVFPEQIGAMTADDNMILADWVETDDHGYLVDVGRVWWHEKYMVEDPIASLRDERRLILDAAPENAEQRRDEPEEFRLNWEDDPEVQQGREDVRRSSRYERPRGAATRRAADAEYDPTLTRPELSQGRLLGIGFNFPRRMQFDLWQPREADALDGDTLLHLTDEFWRGYRTKRWSYMSERGDRMNLPLDRYAQMFRRDLDLDDPEVGSLIRFMVATKLLPEYEAQMVADNFQLGYTYVWDRVDQ